MTSCICIPMYLNFKDLAVDVDADTDAEGTPIVPLYFVEAN